MSLELCEAAAAMALEARKKQAAALCDVAADEARQRRQWSNQQGETHSNRSNPR